ncbi:ABC transporter ATP-binding protein [Candidatus Bipolaricaulota bacterium]
MTDLAVYFPTFQGLVKAVEGVDLEIRRPEVVGLIGETGCGKTVTAYSLLHLIPHPGRVVRGEILFQGQNLLSSSAGDLRRIRGKQISMIFQRPMSSLNPLFSIGTQLLEVIRSHRTSVKREARDIAIRSMAEVALPDPEDIMRRRPFELSGGMQQRVMIAMALACDTSLLIADEPTTALDVSIQLQILKLIKKIVETRKMSVLLISHDMSVIGTMCERINVMYAGSIVESASKSNIIDRASHPYSQALLKAVPGINRPAGERLAAIDGTVPSLIDPPPGCRFAARCPRVHDPCLERVPPRVQVSQDHYTSCFSVASTQRALQNRPCRPAEPA